MKEGPHRPGCQKEEELRRTCPRFQLASQTQQEELPSAGGRSGRFQTPWSGRPSLYADAHRRGVMGTVLFYAVALP